MTRAEGKWGRAAHCHLGPRLVPFPFRLPHVQHAADGGSFADLFALLIVDWSSGLLSDGASLLLTGISATTTVATTTMGVVVSVVIDARGQDAYARVEDGFGQRVR